jgi:PAS domain S-box-containing protein
MKKKSPVDKKNQDTGTGTSLRNRAEKALESENSFQETLLSMDDQRAQVHELQVHQVELELQNEELLRTRNAVEELRDKYLDLYDFAPVGYFVLDIAGRINEVNLTGALLLGYERQTIINQRFQAYLQPAHLSMFNDFCQKLVNSGEKQRCELELKGKDGITIYVHVEGLPLLNKRQKADRIWMVLIDITDRKKAEEALEESRYFNERILQITPNLIYIYDLEEHCNIYANRDILSFLGYTPLEILDLGPDLSRNILHPDDTDLITRHQDQLASAKEDYVLEVNFRMRHSDGWWRWVRSRETPFMRDADGRVKQILGSVEDITVRKKAEDALCRANRQLNLMGGITRHDILNKVTVLRGYLAIARKKSTEPALNELFDKMESAAMTIGSQIEFTRIYQDLGSHEPQWQDLNSILPYSDLPGTVTLHAEIPNVLVYADVMLEKVFFNLLDNSIRHGVRVTRIGVSVYQETEGLKIVWADNGIGIPENEKEKIFSRGFGENTGLGLFLAREILFLTGITIKETGTEDKGARFEMMVPNGSYRFLA